MVVVIIIIVVVVVAAAVVVVAVGPLLVVGCWCVVMAALVAVAVMPAAAFSLSQRAQIAVHPTALCDTRYSLFLSGCRQQQ